MSPLRRKYEVFPSSVSTPDPINRTHINKDAVVATVFCLCTAIATDRLRHRYAFCMAGICVCTTGYGMLLSQSSIPVGARYAAIFLIVSGGYMCQPVTVTWVNNNMSGHYKRAVSSAMMIGFGNAGASWLVMSSSLAKLLAIRLVTERVWD